MSIPPNILLYFREFRNLSAVTFLSYLNEFTTHTHTSDVRMPMNVEKPECDSNLPLHCTRRLMNLVSVICSSQQKFLRLANPIIYELLDCKVQSTIRVFCFLIFRCEIIEEMYDWFCNEILPQSPSIIDDEFFMLLEKLELNKTKE